ncbi:MAG: hypothetical protein OXI01_22420 [Albidovulum sp.]|nr:hypothetical protein [Albidovulum sp.]
MSQIENAPPRNLMAGNEHCIQVRLAASGTGDPLGGIDHEHQNAQCALHYLDKTRGSNIPQIELGRETLA